MAYVVAIIAPGEMGSAVAARLAEGGARIITQLSGRSPASAARAERAGMIAVADDDAVVGEADFVLSIVPPGEAIALAERLRPALARAARKPIYVDCNAIAPATAEKLGTLLADTGCRYVDGGIIGPPPAPNTNMTRIYVSGAGASEVAKLSDYGVDFPRLDGPIGAASALKMSYAGITKGFTAIGVAMALGATRAGCAEALHKELEQSQPQLLAWLTRQVPRMYSKAYRWVAEMEQIGHFLGDGSSAGDMFEAIATLYGELAVAARNPAAHDDLIAPLERFFSSAENPPARKRA